MLIRFCKLPYQNFDRTFIKLRLFSAKNFKQDVEYFSDEEEDYNKFKNEKFIDTSLEEKPKKKCIIKCKHSKFNFYEGQTFPKFEAIPLASRGWHHRLSKGDYFIIYPPESMTREEVEENLSFQDINIDSRIVDNLKTMEINHPTLIQKLGIPKILSGNNIILTAETGCGKTLAFLIPLLQQILQWKPLEDRGCNRPLGLVLTPSRELAIQITAVAKKLAKNLDIKILNYTGGRTKKIIYNPPVNEVDLVISTVGVMRKLANVGIYKLDKVKHVVLDEADTLLDITFNEELNKILKKIQFRAEKDSDSEESNRSQITLNSATIPQDISEALFDVVDENSFQLVTTGNEHLIKVEQKFLRVTGPQKSEVLLKAVKAKIKSKTPIIVFCNTTSACEFASFFLKQFNINSIKLHKKIPLEMRKKMFKQFQNGICNVMVTTDAGARGLDTVIAKEVINFDFPLITSEYIHRCGRTGRIGSPKDCRVINFISRPLEIVLTSKIEFAIRKNKPIPMVDLIHKGEKEGEFVRSDSSHDDDDKYDQLEEILSPGDPDPPLKMY